VQSFELYIVCNVKQTVVLSWTNHNPFALGHIGPGPSAGKPSRGFTQHEYELTQSKLKTSHAERQEQNSHDEETSN